MSNRKVKSFVVCSSNTISGVETRINEHIKKGWDICGNMFYANGKFHQPLARYE